MINIITGPPKAIEVAGAYYEVDWDFRNWINIVNMLDDIDLYAQDKEECRENIKVIAEIIYMVFGRLINAPYMDTFTAILNFVKGYPSESNGYTMSNDSRVKYYSFKHDINYIILAIRNQSGLDLSYRCKDKYHWWDFLLEFKSLTGEHHICKIMGYRAYDGRDREMLKLKEAYALPVTQTKTEQKILEDIDALFYNA